MVLMVLENLSRHAGDFMCVCCCCCCRELPAGMSILLIPLTFDFVHAICSAAVLGFLCEALDKIVLLRASPRGTHSKVAVSAMEGGERGTQSQANLDYRCEEGNLSRSTKARLTVVTNRESTLDKKALHSQLDATKNDSDVICVNSAPTTPMPKGGEFAPTGPCQSGDALRHVHGRAVLTKMPSHNPNKPAAILRIPSWSPTHKCPLPESADRHGGTAEAAPAGPAGMHWSLALFATLELVLSAISDWNQDDEG